MSRPRKYPEELLERGVRLALESGRPIAPVAADLGIHPETLRKRVRQAEDEQGLRPDLPTTALPLSRGTGQPLRPAILLRPDARPTWAGRAVLPPSQGAVKTGLVRRIEAVRLVESMCARLPIQRAVPSREATCLRARTGIAHS